MKEKRKITEHEMIFGVCFLVGAGFITILAKGKMPENTMLAQSLSMDFLEEGWDKKSLFLQCLISRGSSMLLLFILAYTSFRKCVFRFMTAWMGIIFGVLFKLFYCWYGISGAGLLLVSLLPHFLFYWMAYGGLYWEMERRQMRIVKSPIGLILALVVAIIGIVVESYVNPILMQAYLKIFF